ncbi:MAG: Ldh family oxidoreductase [Gammaproteobacteria bacterium]|nr:Ldh family oxidoreductase [Gammaproteobacteria bacterium]
MNKTLSIDELRSLARRALEVSNVSADNAAIVAEALVAADADGLASHGVSRIPFYADQARSGKVDGHATPLVTQPAKAAVRVDAKNGFAFPAIRAGLDQGAELARTCGIAGVVVARSHHAGALSHPVERMAEAGLVALAFSNTPSGIAPWGGFRGSFGTNPIAFACPRKNGAPLVVDLSLSKVARGKVMLASRESKSIPEGWAIDAEGHATTDPKAALEGTMLPIGDAKGAALALMVEILAAGLANSNFAFQASSFFTSVGPPPGIGQSFVVFDPSAFAGEGFVDHVETLLGEVTSQDGVRLPGDRRLALRREARAKGITIPVSLHDELERRADGA